jgi:hypothetical protein
VSSKLVGFFGRTLQTYRDVLLAVNPQTRETVYFFGSCSRSVGEARSARYEPLSTGLRNPLVAEPALAMSALGRESLNFVKILMEVLRYPLNPSQHSVRD